MTELKTGPTRKSIRKFLNATDNDRRREDALELLRLFESVTGEKAVLWGDSIVGFGSYHYTQRGGQEAAWFVTGFSPRKRNLVIYIMPGFGIYQGLLDKLGKYSHSVSCLYINKLGDVDRKVLKQLIMRSVRDMRHMYAGG